MRLDPTSKLYPSSLPYLGQRTSAGKRKVMRLAMALLTHMEVLTVLDKPTLSMVSMSMSSFFSVKRRISYPQGSFKLEVNVRSRPFPRKHRQQFSSRSFRLLQQTEGMVREGAKKRVQGVKIKQGEAKNQPKYNHFNHGRSKQTKE